MSVYIDLSKWKFEERRLLVCVPGNIKIANGYVQMIHFCITKLFPHFHATPVSLNNGPAYTGEKVGRALAKSYLKCG